MNFPFNFIVIPAIIIATAVVGHKQAKLGLKPWFKQLHKPNWTPPGKLIREIWTFLYVFTGLAVLWYWNVPVAGWFKYVVGAILLLNAYYNYSWHKAFFVIHNMPKALGLMKLMIITAVAAAVLMFIHSPISSFLMIPYIVWLILARRLTKQIMNMNTHK